MLISWPMDLDVFLLFWDNSTYAHFRLLETYAHFLAYGFRFFLLFWDNSTYAHSQWPLAQHPPTQAETKGQAVQRTSPCLPHRPLNDLRLSTPHSCSRATVDYTLSRSAEGVENLTGDRG